MVRAAIAFELALALAAWLLGLVGGLTPWSAVRIDAGAFVIGVVGTVPPLAGMALLTRLNWAPIRRLLREVEQTIAPLFRGCSLIDFALIAVAAGFAEELFFRGAVQGLAVRWAGLPLGLAIASALFGLAHLITPTYAVIAAAIGLYLGALYAATGNLLVPIVIHALYDFLALAYWIRRGRPATDVGPLQSDERSHVS